MSYTEISEGDEETISSGNFSNNKVHFHGEGK